MSVGTEQLMKADSMPEAQILQRTGQVPADPSMRLSRQGGRYTLVGAMQLMLNWATFIVVTALGMPVAPANVLGRVVGANAGYWLNGYYTFRRPKLRWGHATRFACVWIFLTMLSTVMMSYIASHLGLHTAWLAKPMVSVLVACVGFPLWKLLVFR